MSGDPVLYLTEADVVSLITLNEAVEALQRGLVRLGRKEGFNVPKALGTWDGGSSMHSLGSAFPAAGFAGTKSWVNTKQGASATLLLWDAVTGKMLAIIEAGALGRMRTSAISGVATRALARPEAEEMAIIGTGSQALTQVVAVALVRKLSRVRVYSPTVEHRHAFAAKLADAIPYPVVEASSLEEATDGAGIVTVVTRASAPFLAARHLSPGTHLNAVGAILPKNAEFAADIFDRAGVLAVDDLDNVKRASREFIDRFGAGGDWGQVRLLSDLLAAGEDRPAGCDLSVFKAMGMGISDLSLAVTAWERAKAQGIGTPLPAPVPATPRWVFS